MKKIILAALNAKYFHSNLAVRSLKKSAGKCHDIQIAEATINDSDDNICENIILKNPDAVGFSCYIWNIEKILEIAENIKKILPNCFIFLGGPEVSYDSCELLKANHFIDMIICGEGEITFSNWLEAFENNRDFKKLAGTTQNILDDIVENPANEIKFNLDNLPFLYDDLSEFENKIIYFEASRGCPYKCSYCMSGLDGQITYMNITKIIYAFEYFLKNNVKQIKLVDRTFNYPPKRAHEIFSRLISLSSKYPDSVTNFHFEITAAVVDDKMIKILEAAPKGLIQLEIGIQSTNQKTLAAINRKQDIDKIFDVIRKLIDICNISVYVDLIAGLPFESYKQFANSFNDVFSLWAYKIHLGFLKVLKGSIIRLDAGKYGLVYTNNAPYKVLRTNDISYIELCKLDKIEQLVEVYYNSNHFIKSISYIVLRYDNPFNFFENFYKFLENKDFFNYPQKLTTQFDMLYQFLKLNTNIDMDLLYDKMLYDWTLMEKPRRYPDSFKKLQSDAQKGFIRSFFNDGNNIKKYLPNYILNTPAAISRMCHIAFFKLEKQIILFDYEINSKKPVQILPVKLDDNIL